MTSENEMLPLPKGSCASGMCWDAEVYTANQMHAYSRANVAHATAAKDAEIEALRARLAEDRALLDAVRDAMGGGPYDTLPARTAAQIAEVEALRAEVSGLRAARIAYANEFPATEDGDPDTGNIHANIRALKARAERLAEALRWAERHCPCGARPESPDTHPHLPGCPVGAAIAQEGGE